MDGNEEGDMELKMLLAVDDSETSRKAVDHVAGVMDCCRPASITLFHVVEVPPRLLEYGGADGLVASARVGPVLENERRNWIDAQTRRIDDEVLGPAKQKLLDGAEGPPRMRVETKTVERAPDGDVARHILDEADEGNYTAVVLGRRGSSALGEFLWGSVSFKVVHHIKNRAVWIVE